VLGIVGALDPHTHKVNQASLSGACLPSAFSPQPSTLRPAPLVRGLSQGPETHKIHSI